MWIANVSDHTGFIFWVRYDFMRASCMTLSIMVFAMLLLFCALSPAFGQAGRQLVTLADLEPIYRQTVLEQCPWDDDSLEISAVRAYPARIWVPSGPLDCEVIRISSRRFLGRVAMEIAVRVNNIPVRTVRVCGRVEAYRNIICAARDIRRGDIIRASSIAISRMPVSKIRNQVFDRPENLMGMAVKHSVSAGQIITGNMVTPPVLIKRGAKVIILAHAPCITVRVPGRAVEQGAAGDFIRVRNLQSRKEILARVRDSRTVTVMF